MEKSITSEQWTPVPVAGELGHDSSVPHDKTSSRMLLDSAKEEPWTCEADCDKDKGALRSKRRC
jgi:hypothetical protein